MKLFLIILILSISKQTFSQKAVLYQPLSEKIDPSNLCKEKADVVFNLIKTSNAFDWTDENNNCEDRANAVSLILDSWRVPNGKIWIFQGETFNDKEYKGRLGGYTYHVASCILVRNNNITDTLIIDPLMDPNKLMRIPEWVDLIATTPKNIYLITQGSYYQQREISPNPNWKLRDAHFEDTIDGLTRYNNFSFWTRVKTKKYLKRRALVLKEYNSLVNTIPARLITFACP